MSNLMLMLNNVTDNFTCELLTEFSKCGIKIHFSYILLEDNNYMAPVQQDLFTQYPYYIYNIPVIYYFMK